MQPQALMEQNSITLSKLQPSTSFRLTADARSEQPAQARKMQLSAYKPSCVCSRRR